MEAAPCRGLTRAKIQGHWHRPAARVCDLGCNLVWTLHDIPLAKALLPSAEPIIVLETADGHELTRNGPFHGLPVRYEDLPPHRGLDFRGILRAFVRNLRAGEVQEGGSTITQQLVKVLSREKQRTITRKVREAVLALWLERHLSKNEILTRYLNNVYFGAGVTGVSAASRIYFDKPVNELTLNESVLLAGLIKAPSQLNPFNNLATARERAEIVLDAMVAGGKLEKKLARAVKMEPAVLKPGRRPSASVSWFESTGVWGAIKPGRLVELRSMGAQIREQPGRVESRSAYDADG